MAIEEESSVREIEFDVKHVSLENLLSPVTFLLFFVVLVSLFNVHFTLKVIFVINSEKKNNRIFLFIEVIYFKLDILCFISYSNIFLIFSFQQILY